jgi:aspartate/methionine/tyrosine aminotransferase
MFNLGWGQSVAVREAFVRYCKTSTIISPKDLMKYDYPAHEGSQALISITADVIMKTLGLSYKHIFITSGATGGCVIAMRAFRQSGYSHCLTRQAPYYVRYPKMIEASGLIHTTNHLKERLNSVALVDLPSNPLGSMKSPVVLGIPVILDAVYLNQVYMDPALVQYIPHDVLVGSYSKLLGINGIRLGFIATNEDLLASKMSELITSEYCGLSMSSQDILIDQLPGFDWDQFFPYARFKLDLNREQFQKIEKFLGEVPVNPIGMFHYSPIDKKAKELLEKAGVIYTPGSAMGTNDDFGRFNLGQSNRLVEDAVKAIIKADKT